MMIFENFRVVAIECDDCGSELSDDVYINCVNERLRDSASPDSSEDIYMDVKDDIKGMHKCQGKDESNGRA